jgi:hypothetical protein
MLHLFIKKHSLLNFLPESQSNSLQNNASPKGICRECLIFLGGNDVRLGAATGSHALPDRQALMPSPDRQAPLLPPARQALMPQPDRQAPLPQPVCQVSAYQQG